MKTITDGHKQDLSWVMIKGSVIRTKSQTILAFLESSWDGMRELTRRDEEDGRTTCQYRQDKAHGQELWPGR